MKTFKIIFNIKLKERYDPMSNTTVKGKLNVIDANGDVNTIHPETSGDKVLIDRSTNASNIPNDAANLQHIINKMGSLAFKSSIKINDFEDGVIVTDVDELKTLTNSSGSSKIPNALVVKNIEKRVSDLENSNIVTLDDTDIEFTSRLDTEINDYVTSTSLTWSSKKLSDAFAVINNNYQLLKARADFVAPQPEEGVYSIMTGNISENIVEITPMVVTASIND